MINEGVVVVQQVDYADSKPDAGARRGRLEFVQDRFPFFFPLMASFLLLLLGKKFFWRYRWLKFMLSAHYSTLLTEGEKKKRIRSVGLWVSFYFFFFFLYPSAYG